MPMQTHWQDSPVYEFCSATHDMLKALGPRLQHLAIGYHYGTMSAGAPCNPQDNLVHALLRHCPLLSTLRLTDYLPPDDNPQVCFASAS